FRMRVVVLTFDFSYFVWLFFFQAEDGIRDFHVTGVQTCALPIYIALEGRCFVLGCNQYVTREMFPEDLPMRDELEERPDPLCRGDRKSVVEGKRVGRGGRGAV